MVLLVNRDSAFHATVANRNYWFIFGFRFQRAENMKTRLIGNILRSPLARSINKIFIATIMICITACGAGQIIDFEAIEVFEVRLAGNISGLNDENSVELKVKIYTDSAFKDDPPLLVSVSALQVKNGDWSTSRKAPAVSKGDISYIVKINDNPSTHECVIPKNSKGRFRSKGHLSIDILCTQVSSENLVTRDNSFCDSQCLPSSNFGMLENSLGKRYAAKLGFSKDSILLVSQGEHPSISIAYGANIIIPILDAGGNKCLFLVDQNNNNYGAGISCDRGKGYEEAPSLYFNGSPLMDAYSVGGDDPSRICVVYINFPFNHCLESYGEGSNSWVKITNDRFLPEIFKGN